MRTPVLLALALTACAPKPAPPAAVEPVGAAPAAPPVRETRLRTPEPLAEHPWQLPAAAVGTLSNGVPVYVVENHEVPMVQVRLTFAAGSLTDPAKKEGLAAATVAMMTRGAGPYDVDGLNKALKRLGTDFGAGAGSDDTSFSISTLASNLDPSLDILSTVLAAPTWPAAEWTLLKKQYADGITARREDPNAKGRTVLDVVTWGSTYEGRVVTEKTLGALSIADMKAWRTQWLTASNAAIYVGGDTTLADIQPRLEARFGKLAKGGKTAPPVVAPAPAEKPTLTLVDHPGATQSIVLASRYLGRPTDPGYADLLVANAAWGGMFTSRLNMNLREDKGYTYGARSSLAYDLGGVRWTVSAPVQSDKTIESLQEIQKELAAPKAGRPLTDEEIAAAKGSILNGYPLPFENPGRLLGLLGDVRRYNLGDAWISAWIPHIQAVTTASAQAAWASRADGTGLRFVVVGDAAKLREPLGALGFVVEERDADGIVVGSTH